MCARTSHVTLAGLVLLAAASSCSSGPGPESVGKTGSAVSDSPYVRLRFAQAEQSAVSPTEENLYATGIIELANVDYQKEVVVHYQGPSGWVDSNASYYGASSDSGNELWQFTTGNYPYLPQYSGDLLCRGVHGRRRHRVGQ
jgi:hypothetical protein